MTAEKEAQIEVHVVAGGVAARYQAAAGSQRGYALIPGGCAYVFEDNVCAAAIGEALHFFVNFVRGVIDGFIGAEFFCQREFFFVAGGGDYAALMAFAT